MESNDIEYYATVAVQFSSLVSQMCYCNVPYHSPRQLLNTAAIMPSQLRPEKYRLTQLSPNQPLYISDLQAVRWRVRGYPNADQALAGPHNCFFDFDCQQPKGIRQRNKPDNRCQAPRNPRPSCTIRLKSTRITIRVHRSIYILVNLSNESSTLRPGRDEKTRKDTVQYSRQAISWAGFQPNIFSSTRRIQRCWVPPPLVAMAVGALSVKNAVLTSANPYRSMPFKGPQPLA